MKKSIYQKNTILYIHASNKNFKMPEAKINRTIMKNRQIHSNTRDFNKPLNN